MLDPTVLPLDACDAISLAVPFVLYSISGRPAVSYSITLFCHMLPVTWLLYTTQHEKVVYAITFAPYLTALVGLLLDQTMLPYDASDMAFVVLMQGW